MCDHTVCNELTPILPNYFVLTCCLLFTSVAYIQVYFTLAFSHGSKRRVNPDQTDPKGAISSGSFVIYATLEHRRQKVTGVKWVKMCVSRMSCKNLSNVLR